MTRQLVVALGLLSVCLLAAPLPAQADSMTMSYHGNLGFTAYVDGKRLRSVTAEFYTPHAFQELMWFGYCVDPYQWFRNPVTPGDPDAWNGPESRIPITGYNWREAAWLMENFAPGTSWLDDPSSVNYSSPAVRAAVQAVQLAIWETVVEPSATYTAADLRHGRFRVASASAMDLAGQYLTLLSEHKVAHGGDVILSGSYRYQISDNPRYQDLIVATQAGSAAAPEPGTLLLFGSAAGLVGYLRRRQRKRAQA